MDSTDNNHRRRRGHLPLLLLHCTPNYPPSLFPFIHTSYDVIDPNVDSPDPDFPILSKSVRLMLVVGPSPLTSEEIDRYPAIECVVLSSAGTNHVDLAACRRRGIRVTSAGDSFSDDVAEYAVALAIDVLRRISAANRFVRTGSWMDRPVYTLGAKVTGKRVGIVGLGSIGSRIAKRFTSFKCAISYTSRTMKPQYGSYTYYTNVRDLASNVDILILSCSLTDETRHIINEDVMRVLGKGGVVVNIGRGALIDEKEMVKLLVSGELGGAGLDVFEHEPRVPDELKTLDNVVLSPHHAVLTPESLGAVAELVRSNLEAFYLGKPLKAQV